MTPNEFQLRMEAHKLASVDELERSSLEAMMNVKAAATDKKGKLLYSKASQIFNAEEATNNIHAEYGDRMLTPADIEKNNQRKEKEIINARYREYMQRKGIKDE